MVNPRLLRILAVYCGDRSLNWKHMKSIVIELFLIFHRVFFCRLKNYFNKKMFRLLRTVCKCTSHHPYEWFYSLRTLKDRWYLWLAEYISRDIWGHIITMANENAGNLEGSLALEIMDGRKCANTKNYLDWRWNTSEHLEVLDVQPELVFSIIFSSAGVFQGAVYGATCSSLSPPP